MSAHHFAAFGLIQMRAKLDPQRATIGRAQRDFGHANVAGFGQCPAHREPFAFGRKQRLQRLDLPDAPIEQGRGAGNFAGKRAALFDEAAFSVNQQQAFAHRLEQTAITLVGALQFLRGLGAFVAALLQTLLATGWRARRGCFSRGATGLV